MTSVIFQSCTSCCLRGNIFLYSFVETCIQYLGHGIVYLLHVLWSPVVDERNVPRLLRPKRKKHLVVCVDFYRFANGHGQTTHNC